MKRYVVGDIHGNYEGLKQALERSPITKDDLLITLGDICDGYSEVDKCIDLLLEYPNRIDIRGNHDDPFAEYIQTGWHPWGWQQGGDGTFKSYLKRIDKPDMWEQKAVGYITALNPGDIPESHKEFFLHQLSHVVLEDKKLFVHGGFNRDEYIASQHPDVLMWDRSLWKKALSVSSGGRLVTKDGFNEIFIGHTTTMEHNTMNPMFSGGVWNLDTGGGFSGKITIMDVDSKEYWQSDSAEKLYPDELGRRRR